MNYQLPPKRFQYDGDPRYDSIRHRPWFATLAKRRAQIPLLEQAAWMMRDGVCTQIEASKEFGIDRRELRDFMDFIAGRSKLAEMEGMMRRSCQLVLDYAYDDYCHFNAAKSICDMIHAQNVGVVVTSRQVVEIWDIDPTFYPSSYQGTK